MQIGIFVGQLFALHLRPHHERVHRSPDARLLRTLQRAWRPDFGAVLLSLQHVVVGGAELVLVRGRWQVVAPVARVVLRQNRGGNDIRIGRILGHQRRIAGHERAVRGHEWRGEHRTLARCAVDGRTLGRHHRV
jgi:hypothetical protein